ncbi:MAG: hypothetical protein KAI33_00605, partial [Elusimicrobiales bacterium]|nr:hypothetical protein [Elusimicrobiales bacterium]
MNGGVGGGLAQFGAYGTIGSYYVASTQTVSQQAEVFVNASQPVNLQQVETAEGVGSVILATATVQGIYPVSNIYDIGPEEIFFNPPLLLTFRYSTSTLAEFNIFEEDIYLYHYEEDGSLVKVPGQLRDTARKEITVEISLLASIFAIFGESHDNVPPITKYRVEGIGYSEEGNTYISSKSSISLTAYDPIVYSTSTGVKQTGYRVEGLGDSSEKILISSGIYSEPINLGEEGKYLISYYSVDKAQNAEIEKSTEIYIDANAPITTMVVDGERIGDSEWYSSSVTLSLVSTDSLTGVKKTRYMVKSKEHGVNGEEEIFISSGIYKEPIIISGEGALTFSYWSEDNVGNIEIVDSDNMAEYKIDTQPPTVEITRPEKGIYWRDNKIWPIFNITLFNWSKTYIIRDITIEVDA